MPIAQASRCRSRPGQVFDHWIPGPRGRQVAARRAISAARIALACRRSRRRRCGHRIVDPRSPLRATKLPVMLPAWTCVDGRWRSPRLTNRSPLREGGLALAAVPLLGNRGGHAVCALVLACKSQSRDSRVWCSLRRLRASNRPRVRCRAVSSRRTASLRGFHRLAARDRAERMLAQWRSPAGLRPRRLDLRPREPSPRRSTTTRSAPRWTIDRCRRRVRGHRFLLFWHHRQRQDRGSLYPAAVDAGACAGSRCCCSCPKDQPDAAARRARAGGAPA